ncbi:transporter [Clostridium sp. PL3]|uniref:Transporter n=1 Tax=Clostridium thailandense TaxID=2794346 RepID=A0A949WQ37_9CLOT|nr:transporter [Clostridium thailandense]MBV7272195.1 transporter [Clostridium thailandense]
MNKYFSLTKIFLKNSSSGLSKDGKRKLPRTILLYIILALSFLPLAGMFASVTATSYEFLRSINQEGIILSAAMTVSSAIIFAFGIFLVMSVFYFSSDVENLLVLPVKPSVILMSKFTVVLIYEYFTEVVVLAPVIVTFGIKSGAGLLYYIYGIVIFFTLPIVPLIIGALISILIMRFAGFTKNKDRFKTIAQMAILVFVVGINLVTQKLGKASSNGQEMARLLTEGNNSLIKVSSKLFINIRYAAEAFINSSNMSGIVSMLIYLLIAIIFLILFSILAEAFYLKGVIGMTQTQARRKMLSSEEIAKQSGRRSKIFTYTVKELNILFRTPVYFMNCVVMNFIWPFFLVIPLISQPESFKLIKNAHGYFNMFISNARTLGIIAAVIFASSVMLTMMNPIAITSISREGKSIFINKFIPMDYKQQILSKVLSAFIINFSGILLMILIVTAIVRPPIYIFIVSIVLSIVATIFSIFVGIFIDLNYPKLDWDNEQRAVKQNFNVIIGMIIGLIAAGAVVFITIKLNLIFSIIFPSILIIFLAADVIFYKIVTTRGVELYRNIE